MIGHLLGSFRARLIAGAVVWITIGVGVSWWVLSALFHNHAIAEFQDELDHHATELQNLLQFDAAGGVHLRVPLSDHRFLTPRSGYYWQVDTAGGPALRSQSLEAARLPAQLDSTRPGVTRDASVPGPTGLLMMHERVVQPTDTGTSVRIAIAMDERLVDEFLASFRRTLGLALASVVAGLVAAAFAQIAFGLRPLGRIRQALQAVQRGEAARLPNDLPQEVAPLAANVNALLDAKEAMIRHARVQAGNLAHALKTPLAILQDEGRRLQAAGQDGTQVLAQCDRMRRQIDYQLAKARAAASRMDNLGATSLGPALRRIIDTVSRIYRDRNLCFEMIDPPADLVVPCEAEDLEEVLGNVIENAAKWARSRVRVHTEAAATTVLITVEDDGPGMPADARERVFDAGARLDEQTPGTGLGLAIVRDVVSLYGGRCWIESAELGGAAVVLEIPVSGH